MIIQNIAYNQATNTATVTPHGTGYGNALVAAYDGENGTGNILWSWHIWVTEGAPTTIPDINSVQFMDRNLGALAATATKPTPDDAYKYFGMHYQHGRKEPFTGQGVGTVLNTLTKIYNKAGAEISGSTSATGGFQYKQSAVSSMATALQAPLNFYSVWRSNCIWQDKTTASMWDNRTSKSIYDPCPFGYKVPQISAFDNKGKIEDSAENNVTKGFVWAGTWWPMSGRLSVNGEISTVSADSYLWGAGIVMLANDKIDATFFNASGVSNSGVIGTAYGVVIRCVKE